MVNVSPKSVVCQIERSDSDHKVANSQRFRRMNPSERKKVAFKARQCFDCLGAHLVKTRKDVIVADVRVGFVNGPASSGPNLKI